MIRLVKPCCCSGVAWVFARGIVPDDSANNKLELKRR
jgi:hypothetical protein